MPRIDEILRLYREGRAPREIAERLGCSRQYVYKALAKARRESEASVILGVFDPQHVDGATVRAICERALAQAGIEVRKR